jgi:endo-1,4-beta-xylanase
MLMRGHNLCWHQSVPAWIRQPENSAKARQIFVDHITTVCKHYAGQLHSWDVVNEAILSSDGLPGGMRKSFWYEQVGPDYIELAFRTARAADPHAKLTYNDYGVEFENDEDAERRRLILELLRDLKKRDVPIDAVGIQSHVKAAQPYGFGKGLTDYMESIREMGLEIYLTELDVNEDDIQTDDQAQRDATIAQTYRDYLRVALANRAVKQVLTWDLSDRFTWLNGGPTHHRKQPNRPQRSLPFDRDYRPKEAFFAIRDSFDQRRV